MHQVKALSDIRFFVINYVAFVYLNASLSSGLDLSYGNFVLDRHQQSGPTTSSSVNLGIIFEALLVLALGKSKPGRRICRASQKFLNYTKATQKLHQQYNR